MPHVTRTDDNQAQVFDWHERTFDLTRGLAAYTGSRLIAGIARVIAKHPQAEISVAFNHKQVVCKLWARDKLLEATGGAFGCIWIVGGWYGTLAAMLFDDPRYSIRSIESFDIDPDAAPVARTLLSSMDVAFTATTADMYTLDYRAHEPDLVINTSCEHIGNLRGWLRLLPSGTRVLLQSNDYFAEPSHVSCVASLEAFIELAQLVDLLYAGELPTRNYRRFMLIGHVS